MTTLRWKDKSLQSSLSYQRRMISSIIRAAMRRKPCPSSELIIRGWYHTGLDHLSKTRPPCDRRRIDRGSRLLSPVALPYFREPVVRARALGISLTLAQRRVALTLAQRRVALTLAQRRVAALSKRALKSRRRAKVFPNDALSGEMLDKV